MEVTIVAGQARLTIAAPDGTPLLEGLRGGEVDDGALPHVSVAVRHAEASYEMQFGSFRIEEVSADPWKGATTFTEVAVEPDWIRCRIEGSGAHLGDAVIEAGGDGEVWLTITAANPDDNRVSVAFACDPGEHFLGFGGQSWDVDHRGFTVPIWVQEDGIGKAETDDYDTGDIWFLTGRRHSTHTPMPIFLSSRGYALLLDTPHRSIFAMCSEDDGVLRIEAWEGELRLRLFYGPGPKQAIERLTAYTGRPRLPPPFAFAPWLDALYGSDNVRRVAAELRAQGVPASVIWTEDWRGGDFDNLGYTLHEDWNVDRGLYPDFEQVASDLHDLGFKFLTYNNTFLTEGVDVWDEAVAERYTIQTTDGTTYTFTGGKFEPASLLDLTNPAAWDWGKSIYRAGLLLGADGFMADFAEWLPTDAVLASGEDAVGFHNLYPVAYQQLNRELFDELEAQDGIERLFFVRSAYLGSQPLVSVVWAGDQQTDFSLGDGFPSIIPMGIGLGVTGFPYYGHDIAGYLSQLTTPTTKELWFRWAALGALSPVMRTHHGKSAAENWNWESDAETVDHMRRWATLHIRLFPYLYGLADQAAQRGVPMMRAIALEYPGWEPGWSLTDQFLLGDRILVAPVVEAGASTRTLQLPDGAYYPLEGGPALIPPAGGGAVTVDAPVTELPAFVPAGTLLVLLPEGVDTLAAADPAAGLVTLADVGDDREIWLWPGGDSDWTEVGGLASPTSGAAPA